MNFSVGWHLCLNVFFANYEEHAGWQGTFLWRQTSWSGSCSLSVPLSVHGVGVSVLPDQWRRHVRDILRAAGEQQAGVAVQSSVPVHLHLPLHLHGAVTLHRPHHGSLRDHQGRKGFWLKPGCVSVFLTIRAFFPPITVPNTGAHPHHRPTRLYSGVHGCSQLWEVPCYGDLSMLLLLLLRQVRK